MWHDWKKWVTFRSKLTRRKSVVVVVWPSSLSSWQECLCWGWANSCFSLKVLQCRRFVRCRCTPTGVTDICDNMYDWDFVYLRLIIGILSLGISAHLTIFPLSNPALNLTFSLLPITSSHPHASGSDSTFDFWRCVNIWLALMPCCACGCCSVHAVDVSAGDGAAADRLSAVGGRWHRRPSVNVVRATVRRRWGARADRPPGRMGGRMRQRHLRLPSSQQHTVHRIILHCAWLFVYAVKWFVNWQGEVRV